MESVIGAQNINHRRKPAASPRDPAAKAFFAFGGSAALAQDRSDGLRKRNTGIASRIQGPRMRGVGANASESLRLFYDPPRVIPPQQESVSGSESLAGEISLFIEPLTKPREAHALRLGPKLIKKLSISLAVLAFASMAFAFASSWETPLNLNGFSLPQDQAAVELILDSLSGRQDFAEENAAMPALPLTLSFSSYTVARNDTLDQIARRFSVRLDTLISMNNISNVRRIQAGTVLKIPNIDGVIHTVKKGENLSIIAANAGLSVIDIIDANDLATQTISPGQSLFLPGARLASYDLKKALGTLIAWPTRGRLSSYFGYRANPFTGVRQFHNGLDIVAPANSPAKAAMDGRVAETGYSAVFGNFVIVSHADSYQTLYAHLSKISVRAGQSVAQGSTVGLIGSTGYSTGTHLHFGLFKNGRGVDPLKMLGK